MTKKPNTCDCPRTDTALAQAVMTGTGDKLTVCADAYAVLLKLTLGTDANPTTRKSFACFRGNPMTSKVPVVEVTVQTGKAH